MENKSILIIGGDMRMVYLAEKAVNDGLTLRVYGIDKKFLNPKIEACDKLEYAIDESKFIVLPLPVLKDEKFINAPCLENIENKITAESVLDRLNESHIVLGGNISKKLKEDLGKRNIKFFDYFESERLVMKNAAITAECAIMLAIQNSAASLLQSRCVIVGFGRIAKFLARGLQGLGARVTIAARSEAARLEASLFGCEAYDIIEMKKALGEADFIFNTVPSVVIGYEELMEIREDCVVIELASKPGGIDLEVAEKLNIKPIIAMSLPGRFAPKASGEIIYESIADKLQMLGGI